MIKENYRHDIDGLRAIAVLSVIIFHIQEKWLPQGFLGVDIFFVISGFLITGIIKKEMEQGQFSFISFYKRRAKRLLPAFLFFVSFISIATYLLFTSVDFSNYVHSLVYALFFGANFYFAQQGDYFDISSTEKPLLHIWSLSIEEQFYFIFPFILFFLITQSKAKYIKPIIIILILVSSIYYFMPMALNNYFLLHARAFELLIGAFFACCSYRSIQNNYIHLAIIILICSLFFVPKDFFIGTGYLERLVVCIATGLLLYLRPNPQKFHILTFKPFIYIGLISYSLYLWHWGVLALLRYTYMQYELKPLILCFAIIIMFGMALISYHWIENPIRRIKNYNNKQFIKGAFLYMIIVTIIWQYNHYLEKFKIQEQTGIYIHQRTKQKINLFWEDQMCYEKVLNQCTKGALKKPTVVLYGDSHAGQYNTFIDYIGKKEGWSADVISSGKCRFFLLAENNIALNEKCEEVRRFVLQNFEQYDTIMIAMYWYNAIERNKYFLEKFEQDLEKLSQTKKQIYIFKDNPRTNLMPLRHKRQSEIGLNLKQDIKIYYEEQIANLKIQRLTEKYPNIYWVDIPKYIPNNFMLDDYPIYRDGDHINPYGALELAKIFHQHEYLLKHNP